MPASDHTNERHAAREQARRSGDGVLGGPEPSYAMRTGLLPSRAVESSRPIAKDALPGPNRTRIVPLRRPHAIGH
jgi:hypothetical protein